jgi:hypothetical protein
MCDDWTDLISYVIQKYLRQVHVSSRFNKTDWSQKSSNGLDDQEDSLFCVKSEKLMQTEERFNRVLNEPTICENGDLIIRETRTEIESLVSQLLNSGLLYLNLFYGIGLILKCFNSLQDSGNSLFGFNLLY